VLTDIFVQPGTLGQGSGGEEWVNILFIVGMAVLWLIGGIAKATRKKAPAAQNGREEAAKPPRRRESWQERLARKALEVQRAAEARGRQATERMRRTEEDVAEGQQGGRPRRPSPPGGRIAIRTGQGGESVMVYEQPSQEQTASQAVQEAARRREREEALTAARRRRVMQQPPPAEFKIETAPPKLEPIAEGLGDIGWEPTKPLVPERTKGPARQRRFGPPPVVVIDYSDPDALKKAILHYEILGKPLALRNPSEQTLPF
jgi:hypothetical protein